MRPQEYLALRWSDIDLQNRVIHIKRAIEEPVAGQKVSVKSPKTFAGRRPLSITAELAEDLLIHRAGLDARIGQLKRLAETEPLLSTGKKGHNYKRRVKQIREYKQRLNSYIHEDLVFPNLKGSSVAVTTSLTVNFRPLKVAGL